MKYVWLGWLLGGVLLVGTCALGATPAHAQRIHTVQRGHTLAKIARHYRVDVWDIAMANDMRPTSTLREGQTLRIPPRGITFVRPGQTLTHIARKHDCSVKYLMRINRIRHAGQVRAGQAIKLPGYVRAKARKRDWGEPEEPGRVELSNDRPDDEPVEVQLVDEEGRVLKKGLDALSGLMRQAGDDATERAHPRLAVLLARISDHFGGRPIRIVSGFREAAGYTNQTSRHIVGRAADIQVRGVPRRIVWDYCRSMAHTGCGFYPRSVFVHVDARRRHAQWVDWSAPGRRPRYGTLRRPYRRWERRHPKRRRVGRHIKHPDAVPMVVSVVDAKGRVVHTVDPDQDIKELQQAIARAEQQSRRQRGSRMSAVARAAPAPLPGWGGTLTALLLEPCAASRPVTSMAAFQHWPRSLRRLTFGAQCERELARSLPPEGGSSSEDLAARVGSVW